AVPVGRADAEAPAANTTKEAEKLASPASLGAGLPAAALASAEALLEAEDFDRAKTAFKTLQKSYPRAAEAYSGLGRVAFEFRRFEEAVKALERAIQLAPGKADYHFQLGRALTGRVGQVGIFKKMGVAGRLRKSFQKAAELDPRHGPARLALATYYANAPGIAGGSDKKALRQARALKAFNPALHHQAMARIAAEDEKNDAARGHYRRSLAINYDPRVAAELGALLQAMEKWPEAFAVLTKALQAKPPVIGVSYLYGRAASLSGSHLAEGEVALKAYFAADDRRKFRRRRAAAEYYYGRILEQTGRLGEARRHYRKAIAIDDEQKDAKKALRALDG
ncbi:MAG: tetratricopeptide repeat protein, partial [Sphingomonadales bacterium]